MSQKVVVASGYFDPLHYGHIEYLERSRDLGDKLLVIVNNDIQAADKKGQPFMPARERVKLVRSLACVDAAIEAIDKDQTVRRTLRILHPDVFTNGSFLSLRAETSKTKMYQRPIFAVSSASSSSMALERKFNHRPG
ncbi:unnamed protein product [Durusdinium trenchii]|uniref:Uncharacterized protein n=2 Tax=Durusdinium trenchii TaxID=1381693 RepID=A0ABP0SV40_9DINO